MPGRGPDRGHGQSRRRAGRRRARPMARPLVGRGRPHRGAGNRGDHRRSHLPDAAAPGVLRRLGQGPQRDERAPISGDGGRRLGGGSPPHAGFDGLDASHPGPRRLPGRQHVLRRRRPCRAVRLPGHRGVHARRRSGLLRHREPRPRHRLGDRAGLVPTLAERSGVGRGARVGHRRAVGPIPRRGAVLRVLPDDRGRRDGPHRRAPARVAGGHLRALRARRRRVEPATCCERPGAASCFPLFAALTGRSGHGLAERLATSSRIVAYTLGLWVRAGRV